MMLIRLVRSWLSTEPPTQSKAYVAQLIRILDQQYLYHNSNPHTRKGGLIGLAATAIALGYEYCVNFQYCSYPS